MGLEELRVTSQDDASFRQNLALVQGGLIFGRITGLLIRPANFSGNNLIGRMSSVDVEAIVNQKGVVAREGRHRTTSAEIVKAVLRETHRSLGVLMLNETIDDTDRKFTEYERLNPEHDITLKVAIEEQADISQNTDLIRGIDAFAEATSDYWGRVYDDTLLEPAKRFAIWLICLERNEV